MNFTLPNNYLVTIDATGIKLVKRNGKQVAYGGVQLLYGDWFFDDSIAGSFTPDIISSSLKSSNGHAIVTHQYGGVVNAKAVYDYSVQGEDILLTVKVENTGTNIINKTAIHAPFIYFSEDSWINEVAPNTFPWSSVTGSGPWRSGGSGYTARRYPGTSQPIAATYWTGHAEGSNQAVNFAVWPQQDPIDPFALISLGSPWYYLVCVFFEPIRPGSTQQFKLAMRFSASTDWHNLLSGYKADVRSYRGLQYSIDMRPMGQFASIDESYIRPDNPYGYNDSNGATLARRFDLSSHTQEYINDWLLAGMVPVNYQGIIYWQPQGIHPRGVQYRPDFNVIPPEISPNLQALAAGILPRRSGLLMRPDVLATSSEGNYPNDRGMPIGADDQYVSDFLTQVESVLARGFDQFYVDSYPAHAGDHNLLKRLRERFPNILLFTENRTVASIPFAGVYNEVSYQSGALHASAFYEVFRWLFPEAPWLTAFRGNPPPDDPGAYKLLLQNKLIPLVEDFWINNTNTAYLAGLAPQYIGPDNQWL